MVKKFYYFGIASAVVYVFAVILGGILWQGYSHVSQAISELIMTTSPNQAIMQPLFWAYNLLLGVFGVGFFLWAKNKLLKTSAISLLLVAFSGVMMLLFPQEQLGAELTTAGLLHLIFAGVAALTTLVALFVAALGFRKVDGYKSFMALSLVFGLIILVNGPLTAMAPTAFPQFFGISERVTIGSFIVWLLIISYLFARKSTLAKTA